MTIKEGNGNELGAKEHFVGYRKPMYKEVTSNGEVKFNAIPLALCLHIGVSVGDFRLLEHNYSHNSA